MASKTIEICDRCGKEIKHSKFPRAKIKTVVGQLTVFGLGAYDYCNCEYDLCSECSKSFDKFMDKECEK